MLARGADHPQLAQTQVGQDLCAGAVLPPAGHARGDRLRGAGEAGQQGFLNDAANKVRQSADPSQKAKKDKS